jgi:hypothetical protein
MKGARPSKSMPTAITGSFVLLVLAFLLAGVMLYAPHSVRDKHFLKFERATVVTPASLQTNDERKVPEVLPEAQSPESYVESTVSTDVVQLLKQHPLHALTQDARSHLSLEDHFVYLSKQAQCADIPIFTSMANVFSDMYWQL